MTPLERNLEVKGAFVPLEDESAFYQLVGGVMAHQGKDG